MQPVHQMQGNEQIEYLIGNRESLEGINDVCARKPFDEEMIEFLNDLSRALMKNEGIRRYPEIASFAFWIRKSSVNELRNRFVHPDNMIRMGIGTAFHIAPSNVPVNFAYSLVAGLLTGNSNIVRVSSKDFEQTTIICDAIKCVLRKHSAVGAYINVVKYDHNLAVNDYLSSMSDIRVIWGGDETIANIRQSKIAPRGREITFADRYSLAVIDSDHYLKSGEKERIAGAFYNDTFFSDQNACSSPSIVVWTGKNKDDARDDFWRKLHLLVREEYQLKPVQAVDKLVNLCRLTKGLDTCKLEKKEDNLIVRVKISKQELTPDLMRYRGNSGFFFEYDCDDVMDLFNLCNSRKCQTIVYCGDKDMLLPLIQSGIKGVDRIVPVGRSMDFDLIWDGMDLYQLMTRIVDVK